LELVHVVVGYNVRFGRNRAGTVDTLRALGARLGFGVDVVGPVEAEGQHVSSSLVREVVQSGDVRQARRLLGRPYALRGRVVVGFVERLRGECAFSGPEALKAAIAADVARARHVLAAEPTLAAAGR